MVLFAHERASKDTKPLCYIYDDEEERYTEDEQWNALAEICSAQWL